MRCCCGALQSHSSHAPHTAAVFVLYLPRLESCLQLTCFDLKLKPIKTVFGKFAHPRQANINSNNNSKYIVSHGWKLNTVVERVPDTVAG